MKDSQMNAPVEAPASFVNDNTHSRDRSLSGSLTPRTMTPHVWGGLGETRSPTFRPNLLINREQGGRTGGIKHSSHLATQMHQGGLAISKSSTSITSSSVSASS